MFGKIVRLVSEWLPFMGAFLHFDQRCEKTTLGEFAKHTKRVFNDEIVHLSAGDKVSLKLFGLMAIVVGESAGASLRSSV